MRGMPRFISVALLALVCLVPAGSAFAAGAPKHAKFEATFEAERKIEWKQPRGVNLIDCKGEHFYEAGGSETWSMKTAKPQKVLVTGGIPGGMTLWTYGSWDWQKPTTQLGLEARGQITRDSSTSSGTTGGWCSPGFNGDPQVPDDCGTRLPTYHVRFSNLAGAVLWSHTTVPWMHREKLGFDDCVLVPPDDVSGGDFPTVPKKFGSAALFNRKQKKITITGSKTFGPTGTMVPNFGVERTSTATVTWKLTLVRKK